MTMESTLTIPDTRPACGVPERTGVPDGDRPDQRLARTYCFTDPDMDLFFMAALGWGSAGGLQIGQAFHVAAQITDGDPDSWVRAFGDYGSQLDQQADEWLKRGSTRAAGEARLQAFASYRSAWQFADPEREFATLYARHRIAFGAAMRELGLPATFFETPWMDRKLPGVFLRNARDDAPLVLVIGGADTCFEDLFLTTGRNLFERGYSVALVDLPGQGITPSEGLHWEADAEKPIAAVVDVLVEQFGAQPGRMALLGLSLGGYFVARAAGSETRFATVMASTPFPNPAALFALSVRAAERVAEGEARKVPSAAAMRSRRTSLWKAGAAGPQELLARTANMCADPARVTVPFLSIVGGGDSEVFMQQAEVWHRDIRSEHKSLVLLDAATGGDGHVQVNNRLRLAQECCGWMEQIFAA